MQIKVKTGLNREAMEDVIAEKNKIFVSKTLIRFAEKIQNHAQNYVEKKEGGAVIEYELNDEEIIQQATRNTGAVEIKKCRYSAMKRAEEKENEFVIYVSEMQVFILPKKDFIQGTPEELRIFLKNEFGSNFKEFN